MPSQEKTQHLSLNQWQGNEYVKRQDFVDDNQNIDEAIGTINHEIEQLNNNIYSPEYTNPQTAVAPIISMDKAVDGKLKYTLKGRTVTNLVENGNFKDGTSGWNGYLGGVLSASNNILTVTGSVTSAGSYAYRNINTPIIAGKRYFYRTKIRVTSSEATRIRIFMAATDTGNMFSPYIDIESPVKNNWYSTYLIVTVPSNRIGNLRVAAQHLYPTQPQPMVKPWKCRK